MREGYIKLDRGILEWEWYKNANTFRVFLHCLLRANWKDGRFEGVEVPRGSFVTSIRHLAKECNLTEMKVRTALEHLENTGEITQYRHSKFSVVKVNNYNTYQKSDTVPTQERHTNNNNRRKKESKKERNNFSNFNQREYNFELLTRKIMEE